MQSCDRGAFFAALASVVSLTLAVVPSASANHLTNSGFETTVDWGEGPKPDGWAVWGNTWSVDSGDANATLPPLEGSRMELTMGPWWCEWCNSGMTQDVAATDGQVWRMSADSYTPTITLPPDAGGGTQAGLAGTQNFMVMKLEFWDHFNPDPSTESPISSQEVIIADANTAPDQWQEYSFEAEAPDGTVMARAAFVFLQPAWEHGAAIVDDAALTLLADPVPTASQWSAIALALLCLIVGAVALIGRGSMPIQE